MISFSRLGHEIQEIQTLRLTSKSVIFISYFRSIFRLAFCDVKNVMLNVEPELPDASVAGRGPCPLRYPVRLHGGGGQA